MDLKCGGYEFNFGSRIAKLVEKLTLPREIRFKIKGNKLLVFDGKCWQYGWFDKYLEAEILLAYEFWQIERVLLTKYD